MSVRVMALVWELQLPDSEKIVLLALADSGNDEGHCWPGLKSLMRKCSKSERTIQGCIQNLVRDGHLTRREVVGKGCNYTVHPQLPNRDTPRSDCTPATSAPPQGQRRPPQLLPDTPAGIAGHPRSGCGVTVIEPSMKRKEPSPPKIAHALPAEWEPAEFNEGTESKRVVDNWSKGEQKRQVEMFKAQHGKRGVKFVDWQKAWSTWVLRSRDFGRNDHGRGEQTPGIGRTEAAALAALRQRPATAAR